MAKTDLPLFSKAQENGNRVIIEARYSKDRELKAKAERILGLFGNAGLMRVLESELGLSGKNLHSGAFFLAKRNILAIVGHLRRIPRKGEGAPLMPDFGQALKLWKQKPQKGLVS